MCNIVLFTVKTVWMLIQSRLNDIVETFDNMLLTAIARRLVTHHSQSSVLRLRRKCIFKGFVDSWRKEEAFCDLFLGAVY